MMKRAKGLAALCAVAAGLVLLPASSAGQAEPEADSVALSLPEAVAAALERSEEVGVAEARMEGARAQYRSARSAALPQVNTQLAYTKALRSVFQDVGGPAIPDSLQFDPDPTAPLEERVRYLEQRVPTAAVGALSGLFSDLPFGNENTWVAGLSVTQPVFTGGRLRSSIQLAAHAEDVAAASYEEAAADVVLQVRQAYYDAALARSAVEIVAASVALSAEHLEQVRLRLEAGRASELEALRAEVELENLRPQLVQARNTAELAVLNLKRLANIPVETELSLTTPLVPAEGVDPVTAVELPALESAAAALRRRASVRAALSQVEVREEQVDIARAAYFPNVSLTGNLSRQAFPGRFSFPTGSEWRDDWTVGFAVQWPLFQGLRRDAEIDAARAQVREAELQVDQLVEGVRIDYEGAVAELERTRTQIVAARRTVEQAERVYELTELRFAEGLATQLDISDARLALQRARLNEVQAYHDAYAAIARAERALGVAVETSTR